MVQPEHKDQQVPMGQLDQKGHKVLREPMVHPDRRDRLDLKVPLA